MAITRRDASQLLLRHFSELSPEEFRDNVERYCPELLPGASSDVAMTQEATSANQLMLLPSRPAPLPLNAYLALALTGLTQDQRHHIFLLSDSITEICGEHAIDVYQPRKKTDPVHHPEVPDTEVFRTDRERVLGSDLLICLAHHPSLGTGEELDFAYNALVPIILISHSENKASRMVTGIPALSVRIDYAEPEDLRRELHTLLPEIRPILEARKLSFASYDVNIVGERIRLLRERLGLTREDVASAASLRSATPDHYLTVDALRHIEESTDRSSNPSLIHLRQIATILKTTVADLVEPDLNERLIVSLQQWVAGDRDDQGLFAARSSMTIRDRNRLIRRLLLRVVDSLEED